ncbi:MAG: alginate export family protein [Kiritimatiellales bacterium]|nr:alginate export family protein [Kiritimatiellales bacterium]
MATIAAVAVEVDQLPWLKDVGADFRFRAIKEHNRKFNSEEYTNDRFWQRFRLRGWSTIRITEDIDITGRLVIEPRYYSHPDYDEPWVRDELLIDKLYLTLRDSFDLPVTTTIGRQSIRLRESWLIGEGTPIDGTRTEFFDAIRAVWNLEDGKTTADLIWIENRRNSSAYLHPVNDFDFDNIEQDERGGVIDLSHELCDRRFLDSYFIYKRDYNAGRQGAEGETYTLGFGGHGAVNDTLDYSVEIAPQFGHKNGNSLSAIAANTWLQQLVSEEKKATVRLGYEFLSGDSDPERHFDKLWGREGLWSDLYTGGVDGFDGRELDSSNLHRPYIKASIQPCKSISAFAEYSLLFADTYLDNPDPAKVDNGSKFKGHHLKGTIEQKLSKHVKHYVTVQALIPGEYYSANRQDTATWFRYSIEFKF